MFETFISLFYDVTEMFSLSKFVFMFILASCVARADRSVNVLAPSAPAAGVLEVTVMAAPAVAGLADRHIRIDSLKWSSPG